MMMVYSAPVLFADSSMAFFGNASFSSTQNIYAFPTNEHCQQPVQAQMYQGMSDGTMAPCAPIQTFDGVAQPAASSEIETTAGFTLISQQRKKEEENQQRKWAPSSHSQASFQKKCGSPMAGQASLAAYPLLGAKDVTKKSKKKNRQQAIIKNAEKAVYASTGAAKECDDSGSLCNWGEDKERCDNIIEKLESNQQSETRLLFASILAVAKALATSKHGCRVVQKAIDVGSGNDHASLVNKLKGSILALYQSPHGNHVVTKMIEVLPAASLQFIVEELCGSVVSVARHQYGCRLLERLLEHCDAEQVTDLVKELLVEAEPLCRHPYGNFVMQHIFEHGSAAWKEIIVEQMVPVLPHLCKHRTSSHVVQRALEFGGEKIQQTIVSTLVNGGDDASLVEIGCTRYGAFVVEQLAGIQASRDTVREILEAGLPQLTASGYGKRPMSKFGLTPTSRSCK
jgi:hypothetical protein